MNLVESQNWKMFLSLSLVSWARVRETGHSGLLSSEIMVIASLMGVTGIIITTRYEAKLLQSQKKLETGRIMIVHLKYPLLSQIRGWKQILRETGCVRRRKWDKKQTWVKIIRNFLLSFVKILGRERRGRGDGNYSRDLILDMWHAALHRPQPPPESGHCQCDESDERPSGNLSSKLKKKYKTWSESDITFCSWWNV